MADSPAIVVGAVAFDLGLNTNSLNAAVNEAARRINAQLTGAMRSTAASCEASVNEIGTSITAVSRSINTTVNAAVSDINSSVVTSAQIARDSVNQSSEYIENRVQTLEEQIQAILNRSDLSERSRVGRIAALYRQQGMSMSEAMTRAWRDVQNSADSAGQSIRDSVSESTQHTTLLGNEISNNLTSAVKRLASTIASAFAIKQVISFTRFCVEAAAQVKALNAQIDQTFKSLETDARNAISAVANESGVLETRLQGVGSQIYSFAKASGMDSVTALNMMQEALKVTADSAAFYDRSIEDTAESLRSFLKGNYANDAALGISCTETTRNAAANKLYGKSFMELSEAQKQLTLLQMVKDANELSGAIGQAARESEGWENVTGNLKEAWKQFKAAIGQPILQALIPIIQNITASIQRLTAAATEAAKALSELFGWDLSTAQETGSTIMDIADSVADSEEQAQKEIEKTEEKQKKSKGSLAGFDKLNILAQPDNDVEEDQDKQEEKNEQIAESAETAKASVNDLNNAVDSIDFSSVMNKIQSVIEFVQPVVNKIKSIFGKIRDSVLSWWDSDGADAFNNFKDTIISVKDTVVDFWQNYISPFFSYVGGTLGDFFDEHISPLWNGILEFISSLWNAISAIWSGFLKPLYDTFIKRIMVGVMGVLKSLWDMILDVFGIIVDVVRGVLRSLQGVLDFITGIFTGDMEKAFKGLAEFIQGICMIVWGVIKGAINLVIDALNTLWSALYGVLKSIVDGVGDFVSLIGDVLGKQWGFSMPDEVPRIPRLAGGGLVRAPTIAMVGDNPNAGSDPEVISPLSKLNSMMDKPSDETMNQILSYLKMIYEVCKEERPIELNAELDGVPVFKNIIKRNNAYKRTHGGRSAFA